MNLRQLLTPSRRGVFSELLVNLSAGWLGTVFVVPVITEFKSVKDIIFILHKLGLGGLSLIFAIKFRELK